MLLNAHLHYFALLISLNLLISEVLCSPKHSGSGSKEKHHKHKHGSHSHGRSGEGCIKVSFVSDTGPRSKSESIALLFLFRRILLLRQLKDQDKNSPFFRNSNVF